MASTFDNDLRLEEMATGENAGSWGTKTNTNLELIADAFGYGTFTIADADTTLTMPDGSDTDNALRSLYLKISSSADLTTTRTLTLAPNTVSKIWYIENNTSGGQIITISQGSGSNINIANGTAKFIATDGGGAGANVIEITQDLAIADMSVDGVLTVADGSASAPSISNTGDTDTGIYFSDANTLAFSTSGTLRARIQDTSFNIGNQAATHFFQAYGDAPLSLGFGEQPNTARAARFEKLDETASDTYALNLYFADHATSSSGSFNLFSSQSSDKKLRVNSSGDVIFYDGSDESFEFDASSMLTINKPQNDRDFRVSSVNQQNMLYVNAGEDRVGIGTASPTNILTVHSTTNSNPFAVHGSNTGIAYADFTNNATTAVNNGFGLELRANSTTQERQIGYILARWKDNTDATRTSDFRVISQKDGSSKTWFEFDGDKIWFNQGNDDIDFRVESVGNGYALFVDATTNKVGVFTSSPQQALHVTGSVRLDANNNGLGNGSAGNKLILNDNDGATQSGQPMGEIDFVTADNTNPGTAGRISVQATGTGGSGMFVFKAGQAGSLAQVMQMSDSQLLVNVDDDDYDFRVKSPNYSHMFNVDGGEDAVGILSTTASSSQTLAVGTKGDNQTVFLQNNGTTGNRASMKFSAGYTQTFEIGMGDNMAGGGRNFTIQETSTGSSTTATAPAYMFRGNGSGRFYMTDQNDNVIMDLNGSSAYVFNDQGASGVDFRVESLGSENAIRVDAGNNDVIFFKGAAIDDTATGVDIRDTGQLTATTSTAGRILLLNGQGTTSTDAIQFKIANAEVGSVAIDTTGTIYATTSDRRLKTDISPIDGATNKLMAMNPVTHKWKADPEADAVHGFIAQEMQEIVPESVSGEDGGEEMMSMDYGRITPVIVAALQEANQKIAELEARIATLEEK